MIPFHRHIKLGPGLDYLDPVSVNAHLLVLHEFVSCAPRHEGT